MRTHLTLKRGGAAVIRCRLGKTNGFNGVCKKISGPIRDGSSSNSTFNYILNFYSVDYKRTIQNDSFQDLLFSIWHSVNLLWKYLFHSYDISYLINQRNSIFRYLCIKLSRQFTTWILQTPVTKLNVKSSSRTIVTSLGGSAYQPMLPCSVRVGFDFDSSPRL